MSGGSQYIARYIARCRQVSKAFESEVFVSTWEKEDCGGPSDACFISPHSLSSSCDLYTMFLFLSSIDQRSQFLLDLMRICRDEHRRASGNGVRAYLGSGEKVRKREHEALKKMSNLWEKKLKSECDDADDVVKA